MSFNQKNINQNSNISFLFSARVLNKKLYYCTTILPKTKLKINLRITVKICLIFKKIINQNNIVCNVLLLKKSPLNKIIIYQLQILNYNKKNPISNKKDKPTQYRPKQHSPISRHFINLSVPEVKKINYRWSCFK